MKGPADYTYYYRMRGIKCGRLLCVYIPIDIRCVYKYVGYCDDSLPPLPS